MELVLKDIDKSFGNKEVLNKASFSFDKGYVYALLGRNGAGKTTLFRIINESIDKDGGEVYLKDGDSTRKLDFKDIFFMVSEPDLPKFLTGREFIRFFVDANKDKIEGNVDINEFFDLVDFDLGDADRLIQDYSTGMKNKLQIIMFLILRPIVILMDEPLTSLDVVVQAQMKNIIRQIRKDHIIIFSTHIMGLAKDICDKICLLHSKNLHAVDGLIKDDPNFEDTVISLLTRDKEDAEFKEASRKLSNKKEDKYEQEL